MPEMHPDDEKFLIEVGKIVDGKTAKSVAELRAEFQVALTKFKQGFSRGPRFCCTPRPDDLRPPRAYACDGRRSRKQCAFHRLVETAAH